MKTLNIWIHSIHIPKGKNMKKVLTAFLCSFFLFGTVAVCGALTFTLDDYTVDAFNETPDNLGLDIETFDILPDDYEINLALGGSVTRDLFRISTNESAVNDDDEIAKPISVRMDFSTPEPAFFNYATGITYGQIYWGRIDWNNPTIFSFGQFGDGILNVYLSEPIFVLNPNDRNRLYGTVQATFSYDREASAAPVPEPSTVLLMGVGLLGLVAVGRRKFNPKE
jgi:hypothetical protein